MPDKVSFGYGSQCGVYLLYLPGLDSPSSIRGGGVIVDCALTGLAVRVSLAG